MTDITLAGACATAVLTPVAGMLLDAAFVVEGRTHRPFARAPWLGEAGLDEHPGHLRELAGEFVAVPFGSAGAPSELSPEWAGIVPPEDPARPHGASADDAWDVVDRSDSSVTLGLEYDETEAVERLERTVSVRQDAPALDFTLTLHSRRPVETAVGLHPILRLPSAPGELVLDADFEAGYTYPGPVWPGSGPTRPGQTFTSLAAVPARAGGTVDLSRLPLAEATEDVVLLAGARGPVEARFADSHTRVMLDWDRSLVPHVMLWISDRALQEEPWRGRYRGLGVEPIAAAFDFANEVSVGRNPLNAAGHRTSIHVDPRSPVTIRYSVEVSSLAH
ncbi:hypothetical protein [Schumannella luteola]